MTHLLWFDLFGKSKIIIKGSIHIVPSCLIRSSFLLVAHSVKTDNVNQTNRSPLQIIKKVYQVFDTPAQRWLSN